jgi:uncharacterized protein YjbJ (UPF0337 family)
MSLPTVCGILGQNKMNTAEVKGNWNEKKGKQKKFAMLTDNDLMFAEG